MAEEVCHQWVHVRSQNIVSIVLSRNLKNITQTRGASQVPSPTDSTNYVSDIYFFSDAHPGNWNTFFVSKNVVKINSFSKDNFPLIEIVSSRNEKKEEDPKEKIKGEILERVLKEHGMISKRKRTGGIDRAQRIFKLGKD